LEAVDQVRRQEPMYEKAEHYYMDRGYRLSFGCPQAASAESDSQVPAGHNLFVSRTIRQENAGSRSQEC
jgi:hypothetical protein